VNRASPAEHRDHPAGCGRPGLDLGSIVGGVAGGGVGGAILLTIVGVIKQMLAAPAK
jgi:hypothetical protein